jgi:hypothetical protein
VAGVWRLFQALEARVETPQLAEAAASLLGCAAFPWALSDLSAALLANIARFVQDGSFQYLHFARTPDFWNVLGSHLES